jgi:ATP-dependent DNA helicase RecG
MVESNPKSNPKSNQKSSEKILNAMCANPQLTIKDLQEVTGLSESGVKKIIRSLRTDGVIERVGGNKGGFWKVNRN